MRGRLVAVLLGSTALGGAAQAAVTFDPGCNGAFTSACHEFDVLDGTTLVGTGLVVGAAAPASLRIDGGSNLTREYLEFGRNVGVPGSFVVEGAGSTLRFDRFRENFGIFRIGGEGLGAGIVRDDGRIVLGGKAPQIVLGRYGSGVGALTVDGGLIEDEQTAGDGSESDVAQIRVGFLGTGVLTVRNGGSVVLDDPDARRAPELIVAALASEERAAGLRAAGGSVTVEGAASLVRLMDSPAIKSGSGIQVTVGRDGPGSLTVRDGGRIEIIDDTPETEGANSGDGLNFGRYAHGSGTALLDNGSVLVRGDTARVQVGQEGIGTLSMVNGSSAVVESLADPADRGQAGIQLGNTASGTGTLAMSGSTIEVRSGAGDEGAFLNVGRFGVGTATIAAGSDVALRTTGPSDFAQLAIAQQAGSTGTVTVDDSTVTVENADAYAEVSVGRRGTAAMTVRNGSTVEALGAEGRVTVGRAVGSVGTLVVDGATTTVVAGKEVLIGQDYGATTNERVAGGTGTVALKNGATLDTPDVYIGASGVLSGTGAVTGIVHNEGGTVLPGSSPGTLEVGGYVQTAGRLVMEIGPSAFDQIKTGGTIDILGGELVLTFLDGYVADPGSKLRLFDAAGGLLTYAGLEEAITITGIDPDLVRLRFGRNGLDAIVTPVPVPVLLLASALAGLGLASRRRARHA